MGTTRRAGFAGHADGETEHYYGIRYAEVRSGSRWSDSSVLREGGQLSAEALSDVPVFPQLSSRLATAMGRAIDQNPQDESAFYLNVWTPRQGERLPVVVFIHGGAWMTGGGSAPWYDGSRIAERGVVVVTLNYRIGPLAHLHESGDASSRNPAFSDILAALRWTQDHIEEFGGDPSQVTVVGQSAGSWYAHLLSISEQARGLLMRVAHLSYASNRPWTAEYQDALSDEVRTELGLASLHEAGTADLLDSAMRVLRRRPMPAWSVPTPYLPTTDDAIADRFCDPEESVRRSHADAVYVRTTTTETTAFLFDSAKTREVEPEILASLRERLGTVEPGADPRLATGDFLSQYEELVAVTSELSFDGPSRRLADAYAQRGTPTHLRVFDFESPLDGFLGGHCLDLPFQFGNFEHWADAPMLRGVSRDEFARISEATITELVAFVAPTAHRHVLAEHRPGQRATAMLDNNERIHAT